MLRVSPHLTTLPPQEAAWAFMAQMFASTRGATPPARDAVAAEGEEAMRLYAAGMRRGLELARDSLPSPPRLPLLHLVAALHASHVCALGSGLRESPSHHARCVRRLKNARSALCVLSPLVSSLPRRWRSSSPLTHRRSCSQSATTSWCGPPRSLILGSPRPFETASHRQQPHWPGGPLHCTHTQYVLALSCCFTERSSEPLSHWALFRPLHTAFAQHAHASPFSGSSTGD